jgi:methylated-DNA-protein-cysteine methyltransferase-like protein
MTFREQVLQVVKQIPYGQVASYGQVAAIAGKPRGAREVGWALASCSVDSKIPWWRVINRHGYLSIRNDEIEIKLRQKMLLEQEGVFVSNEFVVDMPKYQWQGHSQPMQTVSVL